MMLYSIRTRRVENNASAALIGVARLGACYYSMFTIHVHDSKILLEFMFAMPELHGRSDSEVSH